MTQDTDSRLLLVKPREHELTNDFLSFRRIATGLDIEIEKLTNDSAIAFDCPELQNKRVSWRFPIRHYYVPFRSNSLIIER